MKRQIETIEDPNIDPGMAVAEIYLQGQATPFTISGIAESVVQAAKRAPSVRMEVEPPVAQKPAVASPELPQDTFKDRLFASLTAKTFDKRNGTNLYDQLQQKRKEEKIVAMGVQLGLISMTDTVCQRHAHAVDKLRS
jgi:hypothetical protein